MHSAFATAVLRRSVDRVLTGDAWNATDRVNPPRSTADDLSALLAVAVTNDRPLTAAMALTLQPVAFLTDTHAIGLAWQISTAATTVWRWHNGESGGFHAFVAVDPDARHAVAVLANWGRRRVDDAFPSAEASVRAFLGIG